MKIESLKSATGGETLTRINRLSAFEAVHGKCEIHECSDEKTGRRYGKNRIAIKLGGGGRNRGSRYSYQVWAVKP